MTLDAWTLDQIREHIGSGPPLVPLFNIAVLEASPEHASVRLGPGEHVTRPGGSIAGPVQFALADVAIYALILATRRTAVVQDRGKDRRRNHNKARGAGNRNLRAVGCRGLTKKENVRCRTPCFMRAWVPI